MTQTHRKHEVLAEIDDSELARPKSSPHLTIPAGGAKLGQLEIGRGSLF
jgi:hypothetical protein